MRLAALAALFALPLSAAAQAPARPPNIVYIMADDLGWTDLGCQGSRYYETPEHRPDGEGRDAVHQRVHLRAELPADPGRPDERPVRPPHRRLHRRRRPTRFDTSKRPLVPVENVQQLPLDKVARSATR